MTTKHGGVYPPQEDLEFSRFPSRRSTVHSTKGIVACTQPLAAAAGIEVLRQGGNAADAAVATAAALNMTEPGMTGIGGDMFILYYDAKAKKTRAINGSGRSGAKITLEMLRKDLGLKEGQTGHFPPQSVHSVTVPGAAAGWIDTVETFGSGKVTMADILAPAIKLGEEGFPVSKLSSTFWHAQEERLRTASPYFAEMLKPNPSAKNGCRSPRPGEIFRNRNLAKTFRLLAQHGKKGFYEGEVAESLIKTVRHLGGHLELDDLKSHAANGVDEVEPISIDFAGQNIAEPVKLWEHPPNGQGLVALMSLGMLRELEIAGKIPVFTKSDHNSVAYLHALIETLRLAFTDGTWFIADPSSNPAPLTELLSSSYLRSRAAAFSSKTAIPLITRGHPSPALSSSDTTYSSITDSHGNAASFINSNYTGFGSGIVVENHGFTLQNRGANFTLGSGSTGQTHPNIFAPSKRPYHTIIPPMVTHASGALHTCFGVMGGFMQPQGHVQVLLNMLVFGMDPQEALDAPRVCIETAATDSDSVRDVNAGAADLSVDEVFVEEGISEETVRGLMALGHRVTVRKGWARGFFGRGQVVRRTEEEGQLIWSAGSDQRGDGCAMPL